MVAAGVPRHKPRPVYNPAGHQAYKGNIIFKFVWGLPALRQYDYWCFPHYLGVAALTRKMKQEYPQALHCPPSSLFEIRLMPGSRVTDKDYTVIYSEQEGRDAYPPFRCDVDEAGVRDGSVLVALVSQD